MPFRFAIAMLLAATFAAPAHAASVTIYRDRWGIPSIVAGSLPDAMYALGYTMAADDAVQMERNFKTARGRMAELDGQGALLEDGFIRGLGIERLSEEEAGKLGSTRALIIDAFCSGANRLLAERKASLPAWIQPCTRVDVLALSQLINSAFALEDAARTLLPGMGSNQFAIAPGRSANGHALLSIDPHLTWDGIFAWYEFALYAPDFEFRGVTLPGLPFGLLGHNSHVAWSMTNNSARLYDFYAVHTNPDNRDQYSYYGQWRSFTRQTFEMRYRVGQELKSSQQTVRMTEWGPMVPFHPWAIRFTMLGDWSLLDEVLLMDSARSVRDLRRALSIEGISMWNYVFADTTGSISYQYNARVPHRNEAIKWTPAVDGSDPRSQWGPLWTADELPHIADPRSSLLVNANSDPKLTPVDNELEGRSWPPDVTSYGVTTRYARLANLLTHDDRVSDSAALRIATDTLVPDSIAAVRALRQASAKTKLPADPPATISEALGVLERWDGRADVRSRGAALYYYWLRASTTTDALAHSAAAGAQWTADEQKEALDALDAAAAALKKDHGRLDVAWGAVHVAPRGKQVFPVSGFAEAIDNAAVVPNSGPFKDGVQSCSQGSSYRMIVDLDPHGVRSWSILPHGESQDPASPHFADQNVLFGLGQYKDTHFGRAGALASAVSVQVLQR